MEYDNDGDEDGDEDDKIKLKQIFGKTVKNSHVKKILRLKLRLKPKVKNIKTNIPFV